MHLGHEANMLDLMWWWPWPKDIGAENGGTMSVVGEKKEKKKEEIGKREKQRGRERKREKERERERGNVQLKGLCTQKIDNRRTKVPRQTSPVFDEEQNHDTCTPPDTIDTSSQTASRQDSTPAVLECHWSSARPLHSDDRLTPTILARKRAQNLYGARHTWVEP